MAGRLLTIDPDARRKLEHLLLALSNDAARRLVRKRFFTNRDHQGIRNRGLIGASVIDQWQGIRGGSQARAILELAKGIGLVTDHDFHWILREIGERPGTFASDKLPSWDRDRKSLLYDGQKVRQIRRLNQAKNVVPILDAFEEQGWPIRIDDPLPGGRDPQRLRETVKSLNRNLQQIRFGADGSGEGVCWSKI